MRLLKCETAVSPQADRKFSLVDFNAPDIPHYAILSHRWGPDEVTYKDIENDTAKDKAGGYKKLEFCAQQAARDGLLYFWCDTCCINKESSAELSTAINSMFKWYKNATKCYVYLSDVSVGPEYELAFRQSKWFSRGWTLQELIAPTVVEFFSVDSVKLGDKKSLEHYISEVSGVCIEVLRGKPLRDISETERFSWTSHRQTTIEEDAVYCLLGIFDVHMPLLYGEGKQKALARLQREIQNAKTPNTYTPTSAPWIVPFERNPRFTGREKELAELESRMFAEEQYSKLAITGLGGMGKTQLVLELLYRIKAKYPACSVMWIAASTTATLEQAYKSVAQQLQIPGHNDEKLDVKQLVQRYLSRDDAGQWLLVFDNADDIDMWTTTLSASRQDDDNVTSQSPAQSQRLIDLVPRSKRGCVVFTTRNRKAAVKFAQKNLVTVHEMSQHAATELLQKSVVDPGLVLNHPTDVSALLEALIHLPLAITQAAAYINANEITLADYVSLLEEKEEDVIEILSEEFEDEGRYQDNKNPVATTWLISFQQIQRSDPLAVQYLSFIACIAPKEIPRSLLPPGSSRKQELDAIGTLTAYSFLSSRSDRATFDVHRLVHLTTRNWLRKEGVLSQCTERAVVHINRVFPEPEYENKGTWILYLPHTAQLITSNLIGEGLVEKHTLMLTYVAALFQEQRSSEAEAILTAVYDWYSKTLGEEDNILCGVMQSLAMVHLDQGHYTEAEPLILRATEYCTTKLEEEDPLTLNSMSILALLYSKQGHWFESEQIRLRIEKSREAMFGADHPLTISSRVELGKLYVRQGRFDDAEQYQLRELDFRMKRVGMEHPDTLGSMHNLALVHQQQGRLDEAEQALLRIAEVQETVLGAGHIDIFRNMAALSTSYMQQGHLAEAEQLQVKVLEVMKSRLGPNHPDTLVAKLNLARNYISQGRLEEAEEFIDQVIEARSLLLGEHHPDTLNARSSQATIRCIQGRLLEAEHLYAEIFEARKEKLGISHYSTLDTQSNLAEVWKDMGRIEEATKMMQDCIQKGIPVLGAEHPHQLYRCRVLAGWQAEQRNTRTETDGEGSKQ